MRSCMERFERICTPRTGPRVSFRGGSGVYQTSAMPIPKKAARSRNATRHGQSGLMMLKPHYLMVDTSI